MDFFYETDGTSAPNTGLTTFADASAIVDSISSAVGKVADFGFKVQQQQYDSQARSQDLQLKSFMSSLGFQTAVVQAESAATIAQTQAKAALSQAQKQATVTQATGISPTMMLFIFGGLAVLMMVRK